ncbi:MAG: hypothetical protein JWQ71_1224 [Pedosphaera sp.]|nr:hypothetical protein [Pedosphaera sp.]
MPFLEQLTILKQGAPAWNEWRKEHPDVSIDLSGTSLKLAKLKETNLPEVNLSEATLSGADLSGADLSGAELSAANLIGTNLSRANLLGVNLNKANLFGANLFGANLGGADLSGADLSGASLFGADLFRANLNGSSLYTTNFSKARLSDCSLAEALLEGTIFSQTSLKGVKGLEACKHVGPSAIDYHTLMASGPLPEKFLRGCGLSNGFINQLPAFFREEVFYSCFISYSREDESFVHRLHDALQNKGIRCWLEDHEPKPEAHVRPEINRDLRLGDKTLLCCSKSSLKAGWLDKELRIAQFREGHFSRQYEQEVLITIPISLDACLLNPEWKNWMQQHLASRLAADFTGWEKDNAVFEAQLENVVNALRADKAARLPPPKPRL